jgi:hypothetical protein
VSRGDAADPEGTAGEAAQRGRGDVRATTEPGEVAGEPSGRVRENGTPGGQLGETVKKVVDGVAHHGHPEDPIRGLAGPSLFAAKPDKGNGAGDGEGLSK